MLPKDWYDGYPNVWLGATAEDQNRLDQRWPHLRGVPAMIRFISYEPAIAPVRLPTIGPYPEWLICGGESGGGARRMNPQWARDIIQDCRQHGVAVFHKQWGSYENNPLVVEQGLSAELAARLDRHGKGGGLVDGSLVRQFPADSRELPQAA
jgi:protein gp37